MKPLTLSVARTPLPASFRHMPGNSSRGMPGMVPEQPDLRSTPPVKLTCPASVSSLPCSGWSKTYFFFQRHLVDQGLGPGKRIRPFILTTDWCFCKSPSCVSSTWTLITPREKRCTLTRRENLWRMLIRIATAAVLSKVDLATHGRAKQCQTCQQRWKHNHVFVFVKEKEPRQYSCRSSVGEGSGHLPSFKKGDAETVWFTFSCNVTVPLPFAGLPRDRPDPPPQAQHRSNEDLSSRSLSPRAGYACMQVRPTDTLIGLV